MKAMRARRAAACLALCGMLSAACSSGRSRSEPGRRPRGKPVVVGLINMENAPVGSFPQLREGAEAAAAYVNEELGGVGGRPLRLSHCATVGTPPSSQACARRLLEEKPVAVIGGVDLGAGGALPPLEQGRVPYVSGSPTLLDELTAPNAFVLAGGFGAEVLGQATYLTDTLRVTKVSVVHLDLPGLLSQAAIVLSSILRKKGITDVNVLSERSDVADFVPVLTAATANRPDVLLAVFPAQACARIMSARRALGLRTRTFYLSSCAEQAVLDAAGPAAEEAYFASSYLPFSDTSQPNVAVYRDKLRRYARGQPPSILSQTGFSVVMDLVRLMDEGGALTPAALTDRLRGTRNHPGFLSHPFTCDRKQVDLLASVCNPYVRILQNRGGVLRDVVGDWVSGAGLVKLL